MLSSIAPLCLAALSMASPVQKRQEESTTSMMSSMGSSMASSMMAPTASASEFSSAAASAEASASAAGGGASGGTPSFPCPDGFLLSYVEEQATVELPLESVIAAAPEWGSDDYPGVEDADGGNDVGATRTLMNGAEEQLIVFNDTPGFMGVEWAWNLTNGPIELQNDVEIANYTVVQQAYANTTEGMNGTTLKVFSNFCASDQEQGIAGFTEYFNMAVSNLTSALTGASPSGSASGSMSMSMMSASATA